MGRFEGKLRTSIRLTVVAVFLLATTLTAALAIGLQYYFGQAMARQTASELYTAASAGIATELDNISNINRNVMALLAANPELAQPGLRQEQLRIFTSVLEKNPLYYGIYLANADSSFFEVINLDNSYHAREVFRAVPTDRWLVTEVRPADSGYQRSFEYLDRDMNVRLTRREPTDFDAVSRPWYRAAMSSDGMIATEPYLFAQLGVAGQTLSHRLPGTESVIGIDMTMSTISSLLKENAIADRSEIFLYDRSGQVLASSLSRDPQKAMPAAPALELTQEETAYIRSLPVLKVSNELDWPPFDFTQSGEPRGYSVDIITMLADMTGLRVQFVNGYSWPELKQQYLDGEIDLLQSVIPGPENTGLGLTGLGYAKLPYALATKAAADAPSGLQQLTGKTLAIPSGWSIIPAISSNFPQINIVEADSTLHSLELVAAGKADAALDSEIIMRYLARHYFLGDFAYHPQTDAGNSGFPDALHIVVAEDRVRLRELLDKAIAAITPAQRAYLQQTWLEFEHDTGSAASSAVPDETMIRIAADPDQQGRIVESLQGGENWLLYVAPGTDAGATPLPVFVGIRARLDQVIAPFLDEVKLSIGITSAFLLMLLPLSWFFANPVVKPIRQLAAENDKVRRRAYDEVQRVSSRVLELDELSESMVNMVAAIQAHEMAQRKLMDSFIELIAQAIDDKSAYTGGHCERVPELALMLARSASGSALPAFRDFQLLTDDEWREYRIAAWLHDCGKITTPEHIVDKGSKLETIYNRIHEVRMRFEVLWRDAEIEYLKAVAADDGNRGEARRQMQDAHTRLTEDFHFVAQCNVGGEFLSDEDQERLRRIAATRWLRHFDDRLGLSPTEELRLSASAASLPATEQLLSDKPEHLIRRTSSTNYPAKYGIDMDVPAYLANLGEIYNLSVSRGTLTAEDRFRINEHMISTIKMLESLPFPPELSKVPRYASTHH
ncbi:MAG: transporter substrate-binding domain-containing protein, partial [Halieaceae bacterium]|nr:transporter substrate-binding domain-containing protein [Halieaceae bacterium]